MCSEVTKIRHRDYTVTFTVFKKGLQIDNKEPRFYFNDPYLLKRSILESELVGERVFLP